MVGNASEDMETEGVKSWRTRIRISLLISVSVGLTILTASSFAGFFALNVLYENKLIDTWAIMFLELEHQGLLLADILANSEKKQIENYGELFLPRKKKIFQVEKGPFSLGLSPYDFGLDHNFEKKIISPVTLLELNGEIYLTQIQKELDQNKRYIGNRFFFKILDKSVFGRMIGNGPSVGGTIYLMTREGRVIHTTDPSITYSNVAVRPLVQKFIRSPITQGQISLESSSGVDLYGFFYEIPKTNVVMFFEVEKERVYAAIVKMAYQFVGVLCVILVFFLFLIQIPLRRITGPLQEMAEIARRLGQGDFKIKIKPRGFGELQVLSHAFSQMTANLLERDESIRALMIEQQQKIRLEGELEIARNIQQNLLPTSDLDPDSGLEIASKYLPAGECAGDWYSFSYNPVSKETVVIIVDVSGHGTGSSMFTAMIAGLFDQYREEGEDSFPMAEFVAKANRVIYRLGKGKWHATMMLVRYVAGSGLVQVLFGGHTPGFLFLGKNNANVDDKGTKILKPSSPLGITDKFSIIRGQYEFSPGSKLVLYTDGLTEAKNEKGSMWGTKNLRQKLVQSRGRSAHQVLENLVTSWEEFRGGQELVDDACVVILKAS